MASEEIFIVIIANYFQGHSDRCLFYWVIFKKFLSVSAHFSSPGATDIHFLPAQMSALPE
jgi:hypothetical protein